MDKSIFEECYKHYASGWKLGETWGSLAEKFSYSSAEALRNSFKRERDRRGIPSKNTDTNLNYSELPTTLKGRGFQESVHQTQL